MRRMGRDQVRFTLFGRTLLLVWAFAFATLPATAQKGTINPRIPPPPPPPEQPAPPTTSSTPAVEPAAQPKSAESSKNSRDAEEAPPPSLPTSVAIPAGTRIAVVLDTPLSTRIARRGQPVTFRTSSALRVHEQLEIPPETPFTGTVVEVKRPGHFGKAGVLRVRVDRISLSTGTSAEVAAHLDSPDMQGGGRLTSDNRRSTDLLSLGMYTLQGTLLGSRISGGKGAAIGAGAGAAVALLIMMSHRGADVYLEPGMPFLIVLDQPVFLPAKEIFAAQRSYTSLHKKDHDADASAAPDSGGLDSTESPSNPDGAAGDPDRPKLKRRSKKPQP